MKLLLSTLLLLGTSASAAGPGEFKLPPDKAKKFADLYCKNLDTQNAWINKLNDLTLANNAQLRKGSYADFTGTTETLDKAGKVTGTGNFSERWKVVDINKDQATIEIIREGRTLKVETRELAKPIFKTKLTTDSAVSCLMWANFAEEIKDVTFDGKPAIERKQSILGNVEPRFTYAKGVPFDLVNYSEKTLLDDRTEVVTRKISAFAF